MNDSDIFFKTAAGIDEVKARSRRLPPRLRTMLIMIDGAMTVRQLLVAATTLGAPENFLQQLLDQGLVESRSPLPAAGPTDDSGAPVAPPPLASESDLFRAAHKFMNDSVVDALGIRAFFFTLKMEKCFSRDDLRALLPEFAKAIAKGSGETTARILEARVRELLH